MSRLAIMCAILMGLHGGSTWGQERACVPCVPRTCCSTTGYVICPQPVTTPAVTSAVCGNGVYAANGQAVIGQAALVPTTKYVWEARETGKWNPFVENKIVYQLVPRTTWGPRNRFQEGSLPQPMESQTLAASSTPSGDGNCCNREADQQNVAATVLPKPDPVSGSTRVASRPAFDAPRSTSHDPEVASRQSITSTPAVSINAPVAWPRPSASTVQRSGERYGGITRLDDPVVRR